LVDSLGCHAECPFEDSLGFHTDPDFDDDSLGCHAPCTFCFFEAGAVRFLSS